MADVTLPELDVTPGDDDQTTPQPSPTSPTGNPVDNAAPNAPPILSSLVYPDSQPGSRQPRAWLVVENEGTQITLMTCEVHLVRLGQASTFEATMALDDPSNPGASFWSIAAPVPAFIVATNDDQGGSGSSAVLLIQGSLTKATVDFGNRTVFVEGRDKVGDMVDTRNEQPYPNMPTSAVVGQIAGKHGLQLYTDGGSDMAGTTYDNSDWRLNTDRENDWDVVQGLANQDGKVAFVNGDTLYYVAPGSVVGNTYMVQYVPPSSDSYDESNAIQLKCSNDYTLIPENVNAMASSWFSHDKQPYTAGTEGDGTGNYADYTPGRTQQQVQNVQQRLQRQAVEKEYTCDVQMAGDVRVQPTMMLGLSGTGTSWDMIYYMETVIHDFSVDQGYWMSIDAKNSGPGAPGYSPESGDDNLTPPTNGSPNPAYTGGGDGTAGNPFTGNVEVGPDDEE